LADCDIFFGQGQGKTLSGNSIASIILQAIENYPGIVILTMADPGQFQFLQSLYELGFFD
jgi:hypothetical protein